MNDEEEDEDASNEMQWILLRREVVMLPTNPHDSGGRGNTAGASLNSAVHALAI